MYRFIPFFIKRAAESGKFVLDPKVSHRHCVTTGQHRSSCPHVKHMTFVQMFACSFPACVPKTTARREIRIAASTFRVAPLQPMQPDSVRETASAARASLPLALTLLSHPLSRLDA